VVRDLFFVCKYTATQVYEGRKDINRLLQHQGLHTQEIPPPLTFPTFLDTSSSEEEAQKDDSVDNEPLSAKLRRFKGPKIATRKTLRTPKPHGNSPAATEDHDKEESKAEEEASWSSE
jgi:hypothetical protein